MIEDIDPPTPLFAALEQSDDAAAIRAIEGGCDVNARDNRQVFGNGRSPLHVAAMYNNASMISLLIGLGAQVDAVDSNGQTPLWVACSEGNYCSVVALLAKGADATIADSMGRTPHAYVSEIIGRYMAILVALDSDNSS